MAKSSFVEAAKLVMSEDFPLRSEVLHLALEMERKLALHDKDRGRRGWEFDSPASLIAALYTELVELSDAVVRAAPASDVLAEAADVANMAMMVADVCRGAETGNPARDRVRAIAKALRAACERIRQQTALWVGDPFEDGADDPLWTLEGALLLIREIEPVVRKVGFSVALGGSVLLKGWSRKDLDLILYPMNSSEVSLSGLWQVLLSRGWTLLMSRGAIAHRVWEKAGSTDSKHVEAWHTPDKKRVDFFLLR